MINNHNKKRHNMMKKGILGLALITLMAVPTLSFAQKGGLSTKELKEIKRGYQNTPAERALRNSIQAKGMVFANAELRDRPNGEFSHKVESKGIANQERSGRCWLFTGLNVLRAEFMSKTKSGKFFFSQNYSFFWDQIEKSNLFLQSIIDTRKEAIDSRTVKWLFAHPIGDGGQFTGVSDNLVKYGVVPSSVMPETINSNNTRSLSKMIAKILRQTGIRIREASAKGASLKKLEKQKIKALQTIYRLLVLNLGEPPTKFNYTLRDDKGLVISTKEYTPQSFYKEFIGRDLRDSYVMIMNDPSRPYYKTYQIEFDRHLYDGKNWTYINVPMEDLKACAINSIKGGRMMYYSCDVGKELDRKRGILSLDNNDYEAVLGIKLDMTKRERIETGDSGSTHAMTLMAVDLDENGKSLKWMVENSWGADNGYKGHLIMTDEWFDAYTFRVVVEKRFLIDKLRPLLKEKATMLPPWDPMFQSEN